MKQPRHFRMILPSSLEIIHNPSVVGTNGILHHRKQDSKTSIPLLYMKCSICEQKIRKTEAYFGDKVTFYENKSLCESCYYEDEPCATVFYKETMSSTLRKSKNLPTFNEIEGDFMRLSILLARF